MSGVSIGLLAASCAQMPQKKEAAYVPEERKEISFTFDSNTTKESKDGLNLVISKAHLMEETYKVNECGAQPVALEQGEKDKAAVAKPAPAQATSGSAQQYKVVERKFLPENAVVFRVELKSEINQVLSFEKSYFLLRDPHGQIHKLKTLLVNGNF